MNFEKNYNFRPKMSIIVFYFQMYCYFWDVRSVIYKVILLSRLTLYIILLCQELVIRFTCVEYVKFRVNLFPNSDITLVFAFKKK